jgi:hypothetical protein
LAHLKTFATSIQSYVQGIGDVTAADRETLRERWESSNLHSGGDGELGNGWGMADFGGDPFDAILGDLGGGLGAELYALKKPAPKVDPYGQPVGVAPRLALVASQLAAVMLKLTLGVLRSLASWSTNASRIFKKTSRRGWKINAELVRLMYVHQTSHRNVAFIQSHRLQMLQSRPATNLQRPCTGLHIEPVSATPR